MPEVDSHGRGKAIVVCGNVYGVLGLHMRSIATPEVARLSALVVRDDSACLLWLRPILFSVRDWVGY